MNRDFLSRTTAGIVLAIALALTLAVYWPGLSGGWLFDDYPNIVDNPGVQPEGTSLPQLVRAALSSPSSEFKRPLASLSFAVNYLATGLDPYSWKLTNLAIHLLNGLLVFMLAHRLIRLARSSPERQAPVLAAFVAAGWLLLPINLTAVLYVVQRMESLANLFVLGGLIGYVTGRQRTLNGRYRQGLILCAASVALGTALGMLAKETAVMLPLYAALVEGTLFRFRSVDGKYDGWILSGFVVTLLLPLSLGLVWLLPRLLQPATWETRDFTLGTRLLSEARIVADYIVWTLLPTPNALSFYHDDFRISTGLFSPWATAVSILCLVALAGTALRLRRRQPLLSLGVLLYLGCHLLTGTILPLELIYEHRNYFASLGLMLAVVPPLCALPATATAAPPFRLARRTSLGGLFVVWSGLTAVTAAAWASPLSLAEELARRAPDSPRAQYELGRTYIVYSRYDPASPFVRMAYAPLERAASLPKSSILPEQALIFMNARMRLPLRDAWWNSLIGKLRARKPGVQDESSLAALTDCQRNGLCDLPPQKMIEAFVSALDHRAPSPRLLATYADYAWNVLSDQPLALRMIAQCVSGAPHEPAYRITYASMLLASGKPAEAKQQIDALKALNIGGSLDGSIQRLTDRLMYLPADAPNE